MDLRTLVPEGLGEGIMLLSRLLGPHDIVEQQLADVLWSQPGELEARTMDDGLAELTHL